MLLQNPLPLAACVYLRFDPRSGKNLAVALRGSGVALWNGETSGSLIHTQRLHTMSVL